MNCTNDLGEQFANGEWMDSIMCFLTGGGTPSMQVVVPTMIYGTILVALFIKGESPLIPVVISIILSGVIFVAFPASAAQIVIIAILTILSVAGLVLMWRVGR